MPRAIDAAVGALIAGFDGPTLRELAGLSRSSRPEDVRHLLDPALAYIGIFPPMTRDEALLLTLRESALEFLFGRAGLRDLTSWAHAVIGHEGAVSRAGRLIHRCPDGTVQIRTNLLN